MNIKIPDKVQAQISGLIAKIDPKNYYYIFAAILGLFFLADFFLLMRPQIAALSKINGENKQIRDDLKKLKEDVKQLPLYQKQVEQLTIQMDESDERFRSKSEVDYIIQEISRIANQNKIKIDQIMSENENFKEVMKNNIRKYYTLPVEIEGKCNYHNFGRFLNQLERDNVFLGVFKFSLAKTDDINSHRMKLTIKAIVYEEKQ